MQVLKTINGKDDMNCEKFFEFTDHDGTRNSHSKLYIIYIYYIYKVKNVLLVEDLCLFEILNYHN